MFLVSLLVAYNHAQVLFSEAFAVVLALVVSDFRSGDFLPSQSSKFLKP